MPPREEVDEVSTLLRAPQFDPTPVTSAAFEVVVASGPDRGQTLVLSGASPNRVLIGTSPACDMVLHDPHVSRRHAALAIDRDRIRVTDLDSTNGTLVNGISVVEALLAGGESIDLGQTVLQVQARRSGETPRLPIATGFGRVIGASTEMRRLYPLCERLAASDVPVIIEGETGTGKEVLAESLHEQGPRAAGPFVVFDCTAVAPTLVEAELFGHERGAFTGAVREHHGVFELADGGTLLIDEIGDLELPLQAKLLRAIERGEIRRVGSARSRRVNVRILAATRRDLDREVQASRFRDDLFHRLAVARIELPPLRERRGDVALLARHFVTEAGGDEHTVPPGLLRQWESDRWPGNVRELRNAVVRRVALGDLATPPQSGSEAEAGADLPGLPALVDAIVQRKVPFVRARDLVLEEFTRAYTDRMLGEHHGNVVRAAAASGIGRRYFQRIRARQR